MSLGQYNSLGEYRGPHTTSSVFLILIPIEVQVIWKEIVEYMIITIVFVIMYWSVALGSQPQACGQLTNP